MSISDENCLAIKAHHQIGICCETLCDKQVVIDYIEELENKLIEAEELIKQLKNNDRK
jgi:hypothetical protein